MKIFFLEDDVILAKTVKQLLKTNYIVEHAKNIAEAEALFDQSEYDLFIVDLSVPDGSGIDFCKYVRTNKNHAPILILTGEADISKKVLALETGADDYLLKPFNFLELQARIQALLRRPSQYVHQTYKIDDLMLDTQRRVVTRANQIIDLRPKEFSLLEFLIRNKGMVVTRNMILSHLWDNSYDTFTNIVDAHVKNLRDKVDRPFKKKLIHTVHGVGYKVDDSN